eukprot:1138382-Pelagomonas_calceolata.AAC.5
MAASRAKNELKGAQKKSAGKVLDAAHSRASWLKLLDSVVLRHDADTVSSTRRWIWTGDNVVVAQLRFMLERGLLVRQGSQGVMRTIAFQNLQNVSLLHLSLSLSLPLPPRPLPPQTHTCLECLRLQSAEGALEGFKAPPGGGTDPGYAISAAAAGRRAAGPQHDGQPPPPACGSLAGVHLLLGSVSARTVTCRSRACYNTPVCGGVAGMQPLLG